MVGVNSPKSNLDSNPESNAYQSFAVRMQQDTIPQVETPAPQPVLAAPPPVWLDERHGQAWDKRPKVPTVVVGCERYQPHDPSVLLAEFAKL